MSVQSINGDLLTWPQGINVIVHGCNAQGVMGAGIAAKIRDLYPAAYEVYHEAHKEHELKLGTFTVAILPDGKRIVNMVTQEFYGTEKRQLNYEAFYSGLETLRDVLEEAGKSGRVYTVGVPFGIGCGLAGGDWSVVNAMIESVFHESPVPIVIVRKIS